MDTSTVLLQLIFILTSTDGNPIYKFQRFCGNNLSNTLKKYGCVYHDNTSPFTITNGGITNECCTNPCTEYHLVSSYCVNSTITAFTTQNPAIINKTNLNETFYEIDSHSKTNQIVQESYYIPRDSSHPSKLNSVHNIKVSKIFRGKKNNRERKFKKSNKRNKNPVNKKLRKSLQSSRNKRDKKMKKECVCTCRRRRAKVCKLPSSSIPSELVMCM